MDCLNSFDYSKNFEIQRLSDEKALIKIPLATGIWQKEYNMNISLSELFNDFKEENNLDISDLLFRKFKSKNGKIDLNNKLKDILDNEYLSNYKVHKLVGKPFNNPFEIFIFDKITKILTIQTTKKDVIKSLGLNNYDSSSSYCNGNNHLYISGGETSDNKIIDKFFDIDLNINKIEGPYTISPKKNHSMIYIHPNKVFIVGGNDKKTFYFDTIKKEVINRADLNIMRTEPALQIIGNTLYCFDNVNKANNEQLSFEKINIDDPEAEWELIYPLIKGDKFPQKFFAVSKDNKEENIIFLGGNMDDTNDSNNLKNFKYNIESNIIEETSIPFKEFNYKEKTFLPFIKNVDYLLPDFNRQHPEVTFFVKSKSRFEKVNYLPKSQEKENDKYILRRKYLDNKYNFNMPGININLENNNYLPGIKEPSFNNNIDLIQINQEPPFEEPNIEPNKGDKKIELIIPTNIKGVSKGINEYINRNKIEEEKNSGDYQINDPKLKYQKKNIYNSFNLFNNNLNIDFKNNDYNTKIQSSVNEPKVDINDNLNLKGQSNLGVNINLKEALGLNPELNAKNKSQNINIETNEDPLLNIHLPNKDGMDINEIKLNAQLEQPKININAKGVDTELKDLNGNIEEKTRNINNVLNSNIPGGTLEATIPSIGIDVNKKDLNLNTGIKINPENDSYEGIIFGNKKGNSKEYSKLGIINGKKNYKSKFDIKNPSLNIQGGEINIDKDLDLKNKINVPNASVRLPESKLNMEKPNIDIEKKGININPLEVDIKGDIPEGNLNVPKSDVNANVDIKGKDLNIKKPDFNLNLESYIQNPELNLNQNIEGGINADLNGDIKIPKINEPNINIQGSIPQIKMPEHDPNFSGIIEGKMKGLKNEIDLKNKDIDIGLKGSKNIEIDGKIPKVELKSGNLDTNINIKDNIKMPEINELNPEIKVSTNIDKKLNIKTPEIYEDFTGVIIGTKDKTLKKDINIKANLPETKITGEIPGKGSLDIKKPKLDINGPKIGTNLDVNINKPGINVPSTDINVKGPKLNEPLFELKGEIPGKNIKAPKIELKPGEVDLNGKVDVPKLDNNKVNIDAKIPSIKQPDININAEKGKLIFSGVIPGKKNIKVPNVKGDLKIDGNIKKPEIPNINSDINVGIDANKKLDLDQKIKGINIKSPEIGLDSPDINLKGKKVNLPNASVGLNSPNIDINGKIPKIEGNIPGIGINSDMSGIDLNGQVPKVDINIPKSDLNIEGNVPKVELENNIPEMKINGKIPGFDANIKKPELNINGEMDANIPKGEINFDGKFKKPDLKGINLKTNIPELNVKKPEGNLNIDGDIEGKKINIDLPDIIIDKDDEYLMRGIIRGKDYKDLKIKGDIDLKAPEIKGDIKGNTGINAQINSPNIDIPSGNLEIKGPKLDKPNLPNANIKGKDINIDAKIPNVKADLNIKEPKGELIYSGVILGKKNIDAPKLKGYLKIYGKLNGPKIEGPNIELKKPDMNLNLDKDINIKSPEIDVNTPDINLKGKKVNLPNVSLGGNIPNADINANLPKIEGNIPGIDINAGIPKVDINGQIPNINTDMKLKGKIPNVDLEGNIPNMDINVPKVDLEGNLPNMDMNINAPKVDLKGNVPNVDLDINTPKVDLEGKIPNVDLDVNAPKVDLEGKIPNMDMNVNVPKVDLNGNILNPSIDINNKNLNLPGIDINGNVPNLGLNGEFGANLPNVEINNNNKMNIPSGEVNLEGQIPNINLNGNIENKDIKIPKIDAKIESPNIKDINIPGLGINKKDININKKNINIEGGLGEIKNSTGSFNMFGEIEGKGIKIDKPNIKLNKDNEYYISGIIPGGDTNNINIKGSRRMLYDYNINQPEVNIKSSKLRFNQPNMNIKGSRRLDFQAPQLNDNIKGSRMIYDTQINTNTQNIPEISVNSPKIELKSGNKNIKLDKPEINIKEEGELIFSGVIPGKKELSKNIKLSANAPKVEIKADMDKPNIQNKVKMETDINPSLKNGINIEAKKFNILPSQNIDIQVESKDVKNSLKGSNNNIDIEMPKFNIEVNNKEKNQELNIEEKNNNIEIEIPKVEINLDAQEQGQDNNLFNININNQESKVYAKKGIRGLPKVGLKKTDFVSSKIDVGGKLDVNNIDTSNLKPADAGANGTKIGNRIIE